MCILRYVPSRAPPASITAAVLWYRPAARRSNSDAMMTTFASRATRVRASVLGPGIGSARSNWAWSSVWQKYWLRNSSGRHTISAPRWAASRTFVTARSRLTAGSVPMRICTAASLNVGGLAFDAIAIVYAILGEHATDDVANHAVARGARRTRLSLGFRDDSVRTVGAARGPHELGVLVGPPDGEGGVGLDVKLQAERARSDAKRLVATQAGRREVDRAGRQVVRVAVPVQDDLLRAEP